jgi:pimeloyl-CoA synthetase
VLKTAKDLIGNNISFTSSGHFESDSLKSIIAGEEINEQNTWGIKFHLISWDDGEFIVRYSTGLLEGSFIQCLVDKIKFSDIKNELIYYNSKNYFLGSAGGDIYSHIIDFKKLKTYSAHLSVVSSGRVALDLSENIENAMIKNFFVSYFKRDYPALRVIERAF